MMVTIRPFEESDRAEALEFVHDSRAIDSDHQHLYVAEDGGDIIGVGLWKYVGSDEAELSLVTVSRDDRRTFFQLAAACCQGALDAGMSRGTFEIHDASLLALLERTFKITAVPCAWEPMTSLNVARVATQWRVRVDAWDAMAQLQGVI